LVTTSNDVVINARKEGNVIESSTMGIQPVYQMPTGNCGYGDGMYGGGWMWIILILLFAGRGFGWGNGQEVQDNFISSEFIKRDIFNTNQNVSTTGCQTQRDVLENRFTSQQCCCETQKEILENRYQNALSFKDQLYAQQQCCCETNRNIDAVRAENFKNTCDITNAIHAEGEATRALINANTMQDLRDRLEAKDRDLLTANFQLSQQAQSANIISTLQPTPKPAYLTCSPYFAYNYGGCGCNNY
jgi:hypothetical protein